MEIRRERWIELERDGYVERVKERERDREMDRDGQR